jgi:hypothetical protein
MSSDMSMFDALKRLEIYLQTISDMTMDDYDENAIIAMIDLVCDVNERGSNDNKNMAILYVYELLNTDAGIIFTTVHKSFAQMAVNQAKSFLSRIGNSKDEVFLAIKHSIMSWFNRSEDMLRSHGIDYSLPVCDTYGSDNVIYLTRELDEFIRYERNMEDEDDNNDEEEDEYYDDYDNENHDLDDHDYDEDADEDDEEYQQYVQNINNINNYETKIVMAQLAESKKYENDPFYQAALTAIKENSKHLEESKQETETRQINVLRDIIRREIEASSDFELDKFFRCDYKVAMRLTGSKVNDYITKKFGANVSLKYSEENNDVIVCVFDGTSNHEFAFNINIRQMIEELKKEIRKDTSQALYDVGYCKDVAGLISEFVC